MSAETHLLVVDDDDRIRDLLKQYLSRHGHSVTTAADAAAARKLFQTFSFDLAIFDIMMPGEDGLSLLRRCAMKAMRRRFCCSRLEAKPATGLKACALARMITCRNRLNQKSSPCAPQRS